MTLSSSADDTVCRPNLAPTATLTAIRAERKLRLILKLCSDTSYALVALLHLLRIMYHRIIGDSPKMTTDHGRLSAALLDFMDA